MEMFLQHALFQVHSTSVPSAGSMCTDSTTTPETARYPHVRWKLHCYFLKYDDPLFLSSVGKAATHASPFQSFSPCRFQKMCTASHAASRQPAVHRGVAHTRYYNTVHYSLLFRQWMVCVGFAFQREDVYTGQSACWEWKVMLQGGSCVICENHTAYVEFTTIHDT